MKLTIKTNRRTELIDITAKVQQTIKEQHFEQGVCMVYVPHTTAAVTINENADPSVAHDILFALDTMVPDRADFRHLEGNSTAHVKSSLMGPSQMVGVENGRLVLGTWQGLFFCEFDGPRTRHFHVKLIAQP